jgi:four helix bundle protein
MDLVETVYKATACWPSDERFGLTNQVRRAVVSIPSNIAEGQGRASAKEFLHFLSVARGSLHELETQILIASRLSYVSENDRDQILYAADEVSRLIRGLSRSIG